MSTRPDEPYRERFPVGSEGRIGGLRYRIARGGKLEKSRDDRVLECETLEHRCGEAIDRAEAVVLQAIPEAGTAPHFTELVGRTLSHGSAYGKVSASELQRLHERLTQEEAP